MRPETLRADLTFLASDALEGRMSLQNGDAVAIQWIASEFAKAGLQPAENGSFLQPVELIEYRGTYSQYLAARDRDLLQELLVAFAALTFCTAAPMAQGALQQCASQQLAGYRQLADKLVALSKGFRTVYWFRGGYPEWETAGLPVESTMMAGEAQKPVAQTAAVKR